MWHVCSNKFQFPLWLSFGSCLGEFAWCGFSLIWISIYYVRNHLFHSILIMALPVGLNNWNYQQTLVKCGGLFLISCHMLICCEDWSWSSFLYTTEKYLHILLVMTSDSNNCGGFCRPSSLWPLRWFAFYCLPCLLNGSYLSIGSV